MKTKIILKHIFMDIREWETNELSNVPYTAF